MTKQDYSQAARQRAAEIAPKATPGQARFLEILMNDCGFGTRLQRNDYLSGEVGREIKYVSDLTIEEAHGMIDKLKARQHEERERNWGDRDAD